MDCADYIERNGNGGMWQTGVCPDHRQEQAVEWYVGRLMPKAVDIVLKNGDILPAHPKPRIQTIV